MRTLLAVIGVLLFGTVAELVCLLTSSAFIMNFP